MKFPYKPRDGKDAVKEINDPALAARRPAKLSEERLRRLKVIEDNARSTQARADMFVVD